MDSVSCVTVIDSCPALNLLHGLSAEHCCKRGRTLAGDVERVEAEDAIAQLLDHLPRQLQPWPRVFLLLPRLLRGLLWLRPLIAGRLWLALQGPRRRGILACRHRLLRAIFAAGSAPP